MQPPKPRQSRHKAWHVPHEFTLVAALTCPGPGICIVDPDCGDGQLLAAMGLASQRDPIAEALLFGMATDDAALTTTLAELARHNLQYTRVEARPPGRFVSMRSKLGFPILADWLVSATPPTGEIDAFVADALAATQPISGQMALVVPGTGPASGALCAALAKRNLLDVLLILPTRCATLPARILLLVRQDRHDTQIGFIGNPPLSALNAGSANRPWPGIVAAYAAWQARARHPLLLEIDQHTLLGKLGHPLPLQRPAPTQPLLGTHLEKAMYTHNLTPTFLRAMFGTDLYQGEAYWQIGQRWLEHFIGLLMPEVPPVPWVGQTLTNGGKIVAPAGCAKLLVQSPAGTQAHVLPETAGAVVSMYALINTLETVHSPDSIVTEAKLRLDQRYDQLLDHVGAEYQALLRLLD